MVQDIYVAHNIWGKSVSALKVKTTIKSIPVAGDLLQVLEYMVNIHKRYIFDGRYFIC